MLVFVERFGGAIQTSAGDYVTSVVPGVILLCAGFGSATTAVSDSQDMTGGIVDRLRPMDVSGAAAYVLSPSFVLFGSLGRTISAKDVNASSLVVSGGISVSFVGRSSVRGRTR